MGYEKVQKPVSGDAIRNRDEFANRNINRRVKDSLNHAVMASPDGLEPPAIP